MSTTNLRQNSLFEMVLLGNSFQLTIDANPKDHGLYLFEKMEVIVLHTIKVNWSASVLSYVFAMLGGESGRIFRDKNHLKLWHRRIDKKFMPNNCDMRIIALLIQRIDFKIPR